MDVQLDKTLATTSVATQVRPLRHPDRLIGVYWLVSLIVGRLILWDWLTTWNVDATLASSWLVIYLIASFVLSQVLYGLVAHHDGRHIHWSALIIFAIGNGIAETLAFAAVYRVGEVIGSSAVGLVRPDLGGIAGFILGVIFFSIYGGLIHGLFWLRVLPPHLNDSARARAVRRYRPLAEVALVLGWSLCLWLHRDLWTVIFFHTLVDIGLMLFVRPPIFGAGQRIHEASVRR